MAKYTNTLSLYEIKIISVGLFLLNIVLVTEVKHSTKHEKQINW